MDEFESLSPTNGECKYHVVLIPKGRCRMLYGQPRQYLGEVFRRLAQQKESRVEEGQLMVDRVHRMLIDSAEVRGIASGGMATIGARPCAATIGRRAVPRKRSWVPWATCNPFDRSPERRMVDA